MNKTKENNNTNIKEDITIEKQENIEPVLEDIVVEKQPKKVLKKEKKTKKIIKEEPIENTKKGIFNNKKQPTIVIADDILQNKKVLDIDFMPVEKKRKKKKIKDIVINRYNPDPENGLTKEEAEDRKLVGLSNKIKKGSSKSIPSILFFNIFTFFNILMFLIAGWLISVNIKIQNLLFIFPVIINVIIGIIQEIRAKLIIDRLSLVSAPSVSILRDGVAYEMPLSEIVIDDIILISSGKQIPADCIVLSNDVSEVNEALLTGESDAIIKKKGDFLYSGSFVVSGSIKAQVVAIGKDIYIEKLTSQARKYKKPKSELLKSLKTLITVLSVLIVPMGFVLFYFTSSQFGIGTHPYATTVVKTAGAMVGMVPAGLFLLTSMALAVGVIRLADNNTLVQELYCIELLARIDTLCLDKTGTITDGSMNVREVMEIKNQSPLPIADIVSAMLNIQKSNNPTSKALTERFGDSKVLKAIAQIPFSSSRKFSAVEFDKYSTFVIGAPEYVIKEKYDQIASRVDKYSRDGYRVLAIGYSKGSIKKDNTIAGVIWPVGLIAIEDSIRVDAGETIKYFKDSGVDVKVISGDNPITVSRIAQRAGIDGYYKYISLEKATDQEVILAANKYVVFGRVSPKQKQLLIMSMKKEGHTVAMTGDGVNDILALREADTSIAMASGSDAAKNVSHLVLLDSNFSSMPKVVAEGRRVINNVQKVATLFLTKTMFSIMLALISMYISIKFGGIYPFEPRQLFAIEYLAIGAPAFFLALEYNNNRISNGNFLWNIIKSALPGAVVVILNAIIIYILAGPLGFGDLTSASDQRIITSLIVITSTSISLMVLYNVSKPLNFIRRSLLIAMITIFLGSILFIPEFYNIAPIIEVGFYHKPRLNNTQLLLLLVLLQLSYPLISIIKNLIPSIKKISNIVLKFFTEYHGKNKD